MSPRSTDVDLALDAGATTGEIWIRFGIPAHHQDVHLEHRLLPATLGVPNPRASVQDIRGTSARQKLAEMMADLQEFLNACKEALADPDRPGKLTLEPRLDEIKVIARVRDGNGKLTYRRVRLRDMVELSAPSSMLDGDQLIDFEVKIDATDPRQLYIKAAKEIRPTLELAARLLGDLKTGVEKADPVNPEQAFLESAQWKEMRHRMFSALKPYPEALAALAQSMTDTPEQPVPLLTAQVIDAEEVE